MTLCYFPTTSFIVVRDRTSGVVVLKTVYLFKRKERLKGKVVVLDPKVCRRVSVLTLAFNVVFLTGATTKPSNSGGPLREETAVTLTGMVGFRGPTRRLGPPPGKVS